MLWATVAVATAIYFLATSIPEDKVAKKTETVSVKGDAAMPGQLNFQTPATAIMEKIVDLHHDLMFFIIVIVVFVS
jgi:heme/copper-type cytochrome/quinol oxidase subunit 2